MPKLAQTVTATTTQEITLAPQVRRKLLNEFRLYAELKSQAKALELAMDKHKAAIAAIRNETGEMSLALDGFKTTLVAGERKKFDPKKFVLLGGDLDVYNGAVKKTPIAPFEKITTPGEKDDESDS